MITYAEQVLSPLGFKLISREENGLGCTKKIVLAFNHLELVFQCVCPSYPSIKGLGCPLHHEGSNPPWPVENAKKIAQEIKNPGIVKVELESGMAISERPARVLVYKDSELLAEIIAKIESEQGADGELYPCVKLEKKEKQ